MSKKYTSKDNLVKIVQCYKLGLGCQEISQETGVNLRTVQRQVAKFKASGELDTPHHRYGGGRPSKVGDRTLTIVRWELEKNPTITAKQIKEMHKDILQGTAVRTLQKIIRNKLKYRKVTAKSKPMVTDAQRMKRLAFAKNYSSWTQEDWRKVLWTDESVFRVSDTKGKKVWRRKGSDPCDPRFTAKTLKHPPSLMVWGAFAYGGKADLHIFPKGQSVTKDVYLSLLDEKLADCFGATGAEVLQQDGAPCHTAQLVKHWLRDSEVEVIPDWPPNSPDISPIENLWAIIKTKIREEDTSSLEKLEAALRRAWSAVPPSTLQKLADSLPDRLVDVRKRKGQPINK